MFTRIAIVLIALAMLCAFGVVAWAADNGSTSEPVCYNHGDVNGDGVIDNRDAIYTLYHFMYGDEQYPVDQDWDFNGDGERSNKDAIYVLYASMFEEDPDYQLKGFVHSYYDPAWQWDENNGVVTAKVTFKCGCGETHIFTTADENGVTVETNVTKEATCLVAGSVDYTAKVVFDGHGYAETKTVSVATLRHEMDGFQDCEHGAKCKNCDYTVAALGHAWELTKETQATCTKRAVQTYECKNCHILRTEEVGGLADHELAYQEGRDVINGCARTEQYKCANCAYTVDGTTYVEHSYIASVQEATCVHTGEKTYVCAKCGEINADKTETLAINADAHCWNETGVEGHFVCGNDGCSAEKKTVNAVNQEVAKDALTEADELKLSDDGAAMAMDSDTLAGLNVENTIQVSVGTVPVEELSLSAEQQAQIPGGTVYNFEMKVDGETVTDFGETAITISLPYELEEGEDVDAIDVWYINDQGEVTSVEGTYSNGFVTFTTTHFSYYTVTRLTAAERCERYGHMWEETHKDATCVTDGFNLKQCQRCGNKEVDEKLPKLGHDYEEVVVAATCEKDGSNTKTCKHGCGSVLKTTIPALGHDMKLNEQKSTAATCDAPGKEVKECAREGCSVNTETVVAQLTHSYKFYEQKEPDCANKGYVKNKCEYCGKIVTEKETAPVGHNYKAADAVWTWSDDHKTASVTLVCSYDKNHTKELTAVVSSETKTANSCVGSGAIAYTAVATFNQMEYSNTVTVTQAAAGHQPGSQWGQEEARHYHVCNVCGEKVDSAYHNWDDGQVVKAATCSEAGQTKYTCSICGYEKLTEVKATGDHDYHYGVCSVCGFGESTCTHEAIHQREADMSAYGFCEGVKFFWVTCDCGQNKTLMLESIECDLGEPEFRMETGEYGLQYEVEIYTCKDCGLVGETCFYITVDPDRCVALEGELLRIIKNGEVLVDTVIVDADNILANHPALITVETVDLTDYGFCGCEIRVRECPCGLNEGMIYYDDECNFTYSGSQGNTDLYVCEECGGYFTASVEQVESGSKCEEISKYTYTFYFNDEKVYECETESRWIYHNNEVKTYEMLGPSCEDGVMVTYVCRECGAEETRKVRYHSAFLRTVSDLSAYDICDSNWVVAVCPCGEVRDCWTYGDENGDSCWWAGYYDESTGVETQICEICGAKRVSTPTYSAKDENCFCKVYRSIVVTDKAGNTIVTGNAVEYGENHEIIRTAELLGDSCADGVRITESCADCALSHSYTHSYHDMMVVETFDLSNFDMCSTVGVLRRCPCGEEEWLDWAGGRCEWEWISYQSGGNYETWAERCTICGIVKTETRKTVSSNDPCHSIVDYVVELSRDGETLAKFSFERSETRHAYETTLTLKNGATKCWEGFYVDSVCAICGTEQHYEEGGFPGGEHYCFMVDIEAMITGKLCGTLVVGEYSCACAENPDTWTGEEWLGGRCQFEGGYYSEKYGAHVEVCAVCGVERTNIGKETPIEGECKVDRVDTVKFYKDGALLDEYTSHRTYESHNSKTSFQLLGETCDDGYLVSRVCMDCGYEQRNETPRYGCDRYQTEYQELYNGDGICGSIYVRQYGCACGKLSDGGVGDYNCEWQHVSYDDKTGMVTYRCVNCNAERVGKRIEEKLPDCRQSVTYCYTYYLDGEVLCSVDRTFVVTQHNWKYMFTLLGESCEDGYYLSHVCQDCGYSEIDNSLYYDHMYFNLGNYDLSEYGICGGTFRGYGCACGKDRDWYASLNCNWQYTGNSDPITGLNEYYCSDCDTYIYRGEVGSINPATCRFEGSYVLKLVRNGQVLVEFAEPLNSERHDMYTVDAYLHNPEGSCHDGVTITRACKNCGWSETQVEYSHVDIVSGEIDLAEAGFACGGELRIGYCLCGESSFFHEGYNCRNMSYKYYTQVGSDGIERECYERECADCGLKYIRSWFHKKDEGCRYERFDTVDVYHNGSFVKTLERQCYEYKHTSETAVYTLDEGSVTCEDGMRITWICKDCGHVSTGYAYWHGQNATDTVIDLTPYGSICGAELRLYECPCGYSKQYRFSDDSECDITMYWIDPWITNAVTGDQPNADGHVWLYNEAWRVGCGVTDPNPCGLELFKAEYWLVDNCIATKYQTWRIGGQEVTIATGEQVAWHDYQTTINDQRNNGTGIHSWRDECKDCGSYYEVVETWQNHNILERTQEAYNTLNFGNLTRNYHYDKNGYVVQSKVNPGESFWMATESEHTWTNRVDGKTYNEGWTRTYDFTGKCMATTNYWNCDGYRWTEVGELHTVFVEWEVGTQSTCTQYGELVRPCRICGEIAEHERQPMDPTMHNFQWDAAKDKYVCTVCDLESVRGYSGSIAMEDLTDANGADYVIGYWNRDEIETISVVSLILYDATNDNDQVDLFGIEFKYHTVEDDGFCGLSFSKSAVDAAAAAKLAEMGYVGEYAIRISFVPINGDDTLDYAITFDTRTAE